MSTPESLDTCGCGQGVEVLTPVGILNRPALPALAWRIGTQARFKETMLARLGAAAATRPLTSRADDDPAVALIDAWATSLDVLTFHQERFANENYLRTATERRSVLELARAIGYEPAPGVSATTALAFKLETAEGAPLEATVPRGSKVQSIPGQDEKPQLYETAEDLAAKAAWSTLPAKATRPFSPKAGDTRLYLEGVATNLRKGDDLLIATSERLGGNASAGWALAKVAAVTPITGSDPARSYTIVKLDAALPALASGTAPRVYAFRQRASLFGANAMSWPALNRTAKADYLGLASKDDLDVSDLVEWPDWSIYAPGGGQAGDLDRVVEVKPDFAAVAAAARQAAHGGAVESLHRASMKAQNVAASAGGAMGTALNSLRTTMSGVFDTLQSSWPAGGGAIQPLMARINIPFGVPGVATGSSNTTASTDNTAELFRNSANLANSAVSAASDAIGAAQTLHEQMRSQLNTVFGALRGVADGFRNVNLAQWAGAGAQAGNVFKAVVDSSRESAVAVGAQQQAAALLATIDAVASGVAAPPTIERLEQALDGVGMTVDNVGGVANASMLIAASGMVGGTAAAAIVGGFIAGSEVENAGGLEPTEAELDELRAASSLNDAFDSGLGRKMLKMVKGASGEGAKKVHSAVKAAVAAAKRPIKIRKPGFRRPETDPNRIDLDNVYPGILAGGFVVLARPGRRELFHVDAAVETGRSQYLLSGKVTRLTLSRGQLGDFERCVRETTVYAQSEELPLAEEPLTEPYTGSAVIVEGRGSDLQAGRLVALLGTDADSGLPAGEILVLQSAVAGGKWTTLTFTTPLAHRYAVGSLVLNANVVRATHGETIKRTLPNGIEATEVLGSGDGALAFQRFKLKQVPLTYVSADTPSGRASTLEVRVEGVAWKEVPSFYGRGPDERIYTVRHADDGTAMVMFGDGKTGARLPTGAENVTALYRKGTGLEGQVKARQLTLLMSRPLGVKEVVNPEASAGAADPENLEDARTNAPLTVLTLDRVVSLQDYADFARAFAGVGKAAVTLLWSGEKQTVHLTVALADGTAPADNATTLTNLRRAIDGARHAARRVQVQGYGARPVTVTAKVGIDPAYVASAVAAAVKAALLAKFGFAQRQFAQDLTEAEVIAAMQSVPGVIFVDLDALAFRNGGPGVLDDRVEARPARMEGGAAAPADLLTINADDDIHLTTTAP